MDWGGFFTTLHCLLMSRLGQCRNHVVSCPTSPSKEAELAWRTEHHKRANSAGVSLCGDRCWGHCEVREYLVRCPERSRHFVEGGCGLSMGCGGQLCLRKECLKALVKATLE